MACTAGNNPETFKQWESIAMGAIPILAINHGNYLKRHCTLAYNGMVLFLNPNLNLTQFIWNNDNWIFKDLETDKLSKLYSIKQFVAPSLLLKDLDMNDFLNFVAFNERGK